ncbi:hypothetical protein [Azospirillum sp. TSA6c]|uniref:hypothetical protein n=1 Tax=Azospirillum sp. TSA6c TaxID=709813 RepID=UPI0011B6BD98|nr:hypothetical protein [Azospirillum sp. TSA6c]
MTEEMPFKLRYKKGDKQFEMGSNVLADVIAEGQRRMADGLDSGISDIKLLAGDKFIFGVDEILIYNSPIFPHEERTIRSPSLLRQMERKIAAEGYDFLWSKNDPKKE